MEKAKNNSYIVYFSVALIVILGVLWFVGNESIKNKNLGFRSGESEEGADADQTESLISDSNNTNTPASKDQTSRLAGKIEEQLLIMSSNTELLSDKEALQEFESMFEGEMENLELPKPSTPRYNLSDLNILTNPTAEENLIYSSKVSSIDDNLDYEIIGAETDIMTFALGSDKSSELKEDAKIKLEKARDIYKSIVGTMATLPVPKETAPQHLEVTNIFVDLIYSTELMVAALEDTIIAIPAAKIYMNSYNMLWAMQ